jgi:hypothetical protein
MTITIQQTHNLIFDSEYLATEFICFCETTFAHLVGTPTLRFAKHEHVLVINDATYMKLIERNIFERFTALFVSDEVNEEQDLSTWECTE